MEFTKEPDMPVLFSRTFLLGRLFFTQQFGMASKIVSKPIRRAIIIATISCASESCQISEGEVLNNIPINIL